MLRYLRGFLVVSFFFGGGEGGGFEMGVFEGLGGSFFSRGFLRMEGRGSRNATWWSGGEGDGIGWGRVKE